MLAAVDLGVRPPRFFRIAASLLDHILGIEPALQMPATEFALLVFLVTRALPGLLDLHLVMRKLRRSLRARSCNFASRQRTYPRLRGVSAAGLPLRTSLYSKAKAKGQVLRCRMLGVFSTGDPAPE